MGNMVLDIVALGPCKWLEIVGQSPETLCILPLQGCESQFL